ncbi:hypothetical protein [Metabacillus fastidiosus]|uniref:hypothetical protein n=1 Tax=Metabacillus fastidiosus TaxID=1458 RepID=UPI002E1D47CE|nr:hypothetical protein [Metabacillus fastidiosus]
MKKLKQALVITAAALVFSVAPLTPGLDHEKVSAAEFNASVNMLRNTSLNLMGGLKNFQIISGHGIVTINAQGIVTSYNTYGTAVIVGYDSNGNSLRYTINVVPR